MGHLDALKWDGDNRLDRWLVDLAGAKDTPCVRAVSRIVLIAAVRRAAKEAAR
jgi:predicted P-loop ATPase